MQGLRVVGRAVAAVSLAAAGVLAGVGSSAAGQTLTASPLSVTFVQSEFATHYKVDASDSAGLPITYAWTLTPPTVDPACNNYGNLTSLSNEFIWRHGDQDHCDHAKQGPFGHLGVVSVVVSDTSSRCTGSYAGTEGANGSPTASAPLTCTAIAAAAPLTASVAGTTGGAATPSSGATPTVTVPSTAASATATVVNTSSGGGLQWIVVVLIAVGLAGLGLLVWRWRSGQDTDQDFVYPDYSPGAGDDPDGRQPLEPPVLPPLVGPLTPPAVGVVTTDDPLDTDDDDTDCSQLRDRCAQLSAEAAQARANAAQAQAAAAAAAAELATAIAALTAAQKAAAATDQPDPGESWMEDADTGERITERDLMLQRSDEAATGEIHLDDPAHRAQLRQQERDRAHQALTAAQTNERAAHGRADQASAAAAAAQAAAATAQTEANAACAAAVECDKAAAASAAATAPPATPTSVSPPITPPVSPPVTPPVTPPITPPGTPPVTPPVTPPTASRPDCEDGCEPRVEATSIDVQMFLVWAGNVAISGAFQFSEDDVADALARFETWKMIADIGEFVEGFAGSGGDLVSGHVGIDAFLNVATEGFNQWNPFEWGNPIDLQGMAEDSTIDALKKLIAKVSPLRALGTWTMSCPLVRVHVTCTRTYECRGGYWVLTAHQFIVAYGEKIRDVTSPSRDNWDHDNPGRGAVETRSWLYRYFSNQNRSALQKIAQMAKMCAAAK